jgi:hypothetical protein
MAVISPYFARRRAALRRKAIVRTALSGSPFWRSVAVSVLLGRFLRQQAKRTPEKLTVDKVLIGQTLTVAALAPTTRRDKRADRRAAKAAGTPS